MINVSVYYQVNTEFVTTNKLNIERFLNDFKNLDNSKFSYSVFFKR